MDNPIPLRFTQNGLDKFDLYQIKVLGDGNCYFHSFLMAYSIPYRTEEINDRIIKRTDIVRSLRKDLSTILKSRIIPDNPDSKTVYETLGNGNLAAIGKENIEFSLEYMINHLDSSSWCGEEIQELLSNETDKNIFYINVNKQDIYITSNEDVIYKDRNSVVLLYFDNKPEHYDTCALRNNKGEYITHFRFNNPFIQFLYKRLKDKKR